MTSQTRDAMKASSTRYPPNKKIDRQKRLLPPKKKIEEKKKQTLESYTNLSLFENFPNIES